jgi:iron complex outermembrane recepter protein
MRPARCSARALVVAASSCVFFAAAARAADEVPQQIVPPVPLSTQAPVYPPSEQASGRVVDVTLAVVIESDGHVGRIRVITSGGPAFDAAALEAMHQWTFEPATKGGQPIAVEVTVPVHFEPLARAPDESARHAPGAPHTPVVPDTSKRPLEPVADPHDHVHEEDRVTDAGETRVSGKKTPPPSATSDLVIDVGQLRAVPRTSAGELLTLAPGVLLQNHGGEGHPDGIFLRGFDAGEGQDVAISVQGVPLNEPSSAHGHGFADTNLIPPELVRSLHVIEGPFDPRQGDFAVAGSVDYQLAPLEHGLLVSGTYGSFNTMRLFGSYQPDHGVDDTFVGFFVRKSDGFGQSRASTGGGIVGQWEHDIDADSAVRALAIVYGARFSSAGVLREDDVGAARAPCAADPDAQFFCTYDDNQGGAVQRGLASVDFSTNIGPGAFEQQVFGLYRSTRFRENFTGFLLDPPALGGTQRGDGNQLSSEGFTGGARASYRVHLDVLDQRQDLEIGLVARHDQGTQRSVRLRAQDQAPYKILFDNDVRVTNLGAYTALRFVPTHFLALSGGARVDTFLFGVVDNNRPASDRQGDRLPTQAVEAYGTAIQPRVTSSLKLADGLVWQTSLGQGVRSSDASALSQGEVAPFAEVRASETGLSFTLATADLLGLGVSVLEMKGGVFSTEVSRDLVFDEEAGRNVDVGQSWRLGSWALLRGKLGKTFDVMLTGAWTEAFLVDTHDTLTTVLEDGTRLPYVPRLIGRADVGAGHAITLWGESFRGDLGVGATAIGPRPIPFGQLADPIFLLDTSAQLSWRWLSLGISVDNLLDTRWRAFVFNYASNFRGADQPASLVPANHFAAGAPRTVLLTLTLALDV